MEYRCVVYMACGAFEVDFSVNSPFIRPSHFVTSTAIFVSTFYPIMEMNFTVLYPFSVFTASLISRNGNGKHGKQRARPDSTVQPR